MAQRQEIYGRLPGRARRQFGLLSPHRYRLWLADDHLLHVRKSRVSESNKRFYLKDIQALVVCRTNAGRVANLVLSVLAGAFVVLGLMAATWWGWALGWAAFFAAVAALFLGFIVLNTLLGPTCACRLHTAVQVEDLASLGRLRTAQRTVSILRPLIESAQGRLSPEALGAFSDEQSEAQPSAHADPVPHPLTAPERRHEHGKVHAAVFCALFVLAVSAAIDIIYQHHFKNSMDTLCFGASVILAVIALARQHNTDIPGDVRRVTWAALGVLIGSFLFAIVYGMFYAMAHPEFWGTISPSDIRVEGPVFVGYCAVVAIVFSVLGVVGLSLLRRFRAAYASSKAAAAENATPEGEQ